MNDKTATIRKALKEYLGLGSSLPTLLQKGFWGPVVGVVWLYSGYVLGS